MKKEKDSETDPGLPHCSFCWKQLEEMKDSKTEFFAGDGSTRLKIVDANAREKTLHFISNTGKISWPLKYQRLVEIHDRIHQKEVALTPYEIDKILPTWGNYITGLLRYLGCDKP
jgi:hypothetical protein